MTPNTDFNGRYISENRHILNGILIGIYTHPILNSVNSNVVK